MALREPRDFTLPLLFPTPNHIQTPPPTSTPPKKNLTQCPAFQHRQDPQAGTVLLAWEKWETKEPHPGLFLWTGACGLGVIV